MLPAATLLLLALTGTVQAPPTPAVSPAEAAPLLRSAQQLGKTFAYVAQQAVPAVVNINTTTIVPGQEIVDPFSGPFGDLFGNGRGRRYRTPDQKVSSLGSGVILSPDGWIVTNNHVISGAQEITVSLEDGREFKATVRGCDGETDLAVLKVAAPGLPHLKWGDSDRLEVGEWVLAIGNPFGFSNSVSAGIVSAKGRVQAGESPLQDLIQTDAAVNPGSSGGALVNLSGELLGINTSIYSRSGGYQGISFAVPANLARTVVDQIIAHGDIARGWIGIEAADITADYARQLGLGEGGVAVIGLYRNQPALQAGLQGRDIIVAASGGPVKSSRDLRRAILDTAVGATLQLKVLRRGQTLTVPVTVIARPANSQGQRVGGL